MKIVWVALGLLVAGIGLGVACGPKENYCYSEGMPCGDITRAREKDDATWDGYMFPDAKMYHCSAPDGATFDSPDPCPS